MDRQVVKIRIYILAEPMVFVTCAGAELQALGRIIDLARAMIDIAEVTFNSAAGADSPGQTVRIDHVVQFREIVFFGEDRNEKRSVRDSGLTNSKTGMLFSVDQDDTYALLAQDRRE